MSAKAIIWGKRLQLMYRVEIIINKFKESQFILNKNENLSK